jgi:predicted GNAT superfamily acetyltransferase
MAARPAGATVTGVVSHAPLSADMLDEARRRAAGAAERAGIEIDLVEDVIVLKEMDRLFAEVWGGGSQDAVSVNIMKALAHAGHYVAAATTSGEVVGAAVGFAHGPGPDRYLHSHITGVTPRSQGRGVGYALKLHQAAWAADRGLEAITWTYDPLIRRNAWFNLVKLGARAEAYYPDFYGPMEDGINGGDETDRCLAVWHLDVARRSTVDVQDWATTAIRVGPGGEPRTDPSWPAGASSVRCQIPPDIVETRRSDPDLARRWRRALRDVLGRAMAEGYVATSISGDGFYLLERSGT